MDGVTVAVGPYVAIGVDVLAIDVDVLDVPIGAGVGVVVGAVSVGEAFIVNLVNAIAELP